MLLLRHLRPLITTVTPTRRVGVFLRRLSDFLLTVDPSVLQLQALHAKSPLAGA